MVIYGIDPNKTVRCFYYNLGDGKEHETSGAGFPDERDRAVTYEVAYHDGTRSSVTRAEVEAYAKERMDAYDEKTRKERLARVAKVEELFTRLGRVAVLLGNWTAVDERHAEHQDAANFTLACGGHGGPRVGVLVNREGRLALGGQAPSGTDFGSWEGFRITLARDSGPEKIAREIKRRLLPKYLPALREAGRQAHVHGLAERAAERSARALAETFWSNAHQRGDEWTVWASRDGWGAVTITVSPGTPQQPRYRVEGSIEPEAMAALTKSFQR